MPFPVKSIPKQEEIKVKVEVVGWYGKVIRATGGVNSVQIFFIEFVAKAFLVKANYDLSDYGRFNGYDKNNKTIHKDKIHF